jgi:hypothetical protein
MFCDTRKVFVVDSSCQVHNLSLVSAILEHSILPFNEISCSDGLW